MVKVKVSAEVRPTEDRSRVERAILNLFPGAKPLAEEDYRIVFATADLKHFASLLESLRIRDPARSVMRRGLSADGKWTTFALNKQAAFVGKVNFAQAPGPLGDIIVEIVADSAEALQELVQRIAPDTAAPDFVGDEIDAELRREHQASLAGETNAESGDETSHDVAPGHPGPRKHGTAFERAGKRIRRGDD